MFHHLDDDILALPKAELHAHLEGTLSPQMARRKAKEHNITLPNDLFDGEDSYRWTDFIHMVTSIYDAIAATICTTRDYEDITYDYLIRCAAENCLYVELFVSPDHCVRLGLLYGDVLDAIAKGIERAHRETGIEARLDVVLVRHLSSEELYKTTQLIIETPHPYVVGIDIAGAEREGDVLQYRPYVDSIMQATGGDLQMRMHAAENAGPRNAWDALELQSVRLGHGVRSIEDAALVSELKRRGTVLEVCPTSNILAGIYTSYEDHPLRALYDAGVKVTLNSDDPGLFGNSVGLEYQIAKGHFGFTNAELLDITNTAIRGSFAPNTVKEKIIEKTFEQNSVA